MSHSVGNKAGASVGSAEGTSVHNAVGVSIVDKARDREIGAREVRVRYFAAAAEAAGTEHEVMMLSADATLDALRTKLIERYGAPMSKVLRSGSFLVGGKVRRDGGVILAPTAAASASTGPTALVIDVLPPFAGG